MIGKQSLLPALVALAFAAPAAAVTTTTVIVELDDDPGAVYLARQEATGATVSSRALRSYRDGLEQDQDQLLQQIAASGIDASLKQLSVSDWLGLPAAIIDYRYTMVFNGVAVEVPVTQVHQLKGLPGVKKVHRSEMLYTSLANSVPFTRAPMLYGGVAETGPFDDLREGYEGQGIHISVIDTGIEFQHEMFGGDATPPRLGVLPSSALVPENQKVVYSIPMGDPAIEDGYGHGTHVASTAAGYLGYTWGPDNVPGTADDEAIHGTAPQARLHSYSVCSTVGSATATAGCLGPTIMLALEDSVSDRTLTGQAKPKAHVINMSLGSASGTPTSSTALAASNAALAGAIVVAAAGNDGNVPGIVGSPSTGTHVISVAASTDPGAAAAWFTDVEAPGERQDIKVFPMAGTPAPAPGGITQRYVWVPNSPTAAQYPASVAGRIALVDIGGAALFAETANNAALAGAAAVLMISDTENATAVTGSIPAATIHQADADYLLSLMGPAPASGDVSTVDITLEASAGAFRAGIAGFSSRGPVTGFGQVKPDVSAPGVDVLAAVPPASVIGGLAATSDGPMYGSISGTSMATPHVAGIAGQIKQANPTFGPAEVRTALINSATPMRDALGGEDSYGSHNPNIHSQGGGLVDAFDAANIKALMGVVGDGVNTPRILGSHSFGNVPSLDNQCVSNEGVQGVIRDVRGQAGTYHLRVENNRGLDLPGVTAMVSPATVNVPANGEASFTASLELDSAAFAGSDLADFQWYVVAERGDGSETLSMPMYYRAVPSIPGGDGSVMVETREYDGVMGPGASQAADVLGTDKTYLDVPVEVGPGGLRLVADLEADAVTNAAYPDLDMVLLDPNGNQIGSSGNIGSVEHIDATIAGAGTYIYRVENYLGVDASFTLTVDVHSQGQGVGPATLAAIDGEYTDLAGDEVDFDGGFELSWSGTGAETAFYVERRTGGAWERIAQLSPQTTSYTVSGAPEGEQAYRIISDFPGAICTYTADPSNEAAIIVDYRQPVTLSDGQFSASIASATFDGSEFVVDLVATNDAAQTWLNPVTVQIVGIEGDASIVVTNADNGGDGRANPAEFSYVEQIGGESWDSGETTAAREVRFHNPNGKLFTILVQATVWAK